MLSKRRSTDTPQSAKTNIAQRKSITGETIKPNQKFILERDLRLILKFLFQNLKNKILRKISLITLLEIKKETIVITVRIHLLKINSDSNPKNINVESILYDGLDEFFLSGFFITNAMDIITSILKTPDNYIMVYKETYDLFFEVLIHL